MLTYGGGLTLHTASSGRVAGLDTLYLRLIENGIEATGEVRINSTYLNGLEAEDLVEEALDLLPRLSLAPDFSQAIDDPPAALARASAPLRMLVDIALHDFEAKRAGLPLASHLAGTPSMAIVGHPTNQSLFVSDDATLLRRAQAYVERGFTDLKLRIGSLDFEHDLQRLTLLRDRFGSRVRLAADANGAWDMKDVHSRLDALEHLALSYIEQPATASLEALARLGDDSPIPVMLDESLNDERAVGELASGGHRLMAHLKLVKLGGIAPTLRAAKALNAAGVPVMIGQMNEGGIATAAALHLAAALKPAFAELYGADGLENDAGLGLRYGEGCVSAPLRAGLGLSFHANRTRTLWEETR